MKMVWILLALFVFKGSSVDQKQEQEVKYVSTDDKCKPGDTLCEVRVYEVEVIVIPVLLVASFIFTFLFILVMRLCPFTCQHLLGTKKKRGAFPGVAAPISQPPQGNEYIALSAPPAQPPEIPRELISRVLEPLPSQLPLLYPGFSQGGANVTLQRGQFSTPTQPTGGRAVIVRALNESASRAEAQEFLGRARFEVELGKHPHLVETLGVCSQGTPLLIITEELQHRDLLDFLWRCRRDVLRMDQGIPCDLTEKGVLRIAREVASGLEYLHGKGYLHGDVAARSVLIGEGLTAKLGRLGTAYWTHSRGAVPAGEGAWFRKWHAPERLARRPTTPSSDVWSFGIMLCEMMTLGDAPFPEIPPEELLQQLQRGYTLKRPPNCKTALYNIMKACCQWKASDRPSLAELSRRLQSGEKHGDDRTVLRVPEPINMIQYLREAGFPLPSDYSIL
ncbi:tyrosine-protein kinase STYK1-like isoform X2 [Acipenser ruthenus]|uniref:tyrosine-protein kinase STYK1-like isoform X2 n=1 Tax=Acipenser ruthenus TaxID=7906 RepID=UPI00145A31DD|nr:tyrosine-protein kinase STYK1-like isoform X2 [Acipenser ruthenus]